MKKQLIATLVGGLILFVWQFLSWSLLNIHGSEMAYSPNQDKILENLAQNLEEGSYFMPGVPPGTSGEAAQAAMEANVGKPWATISYHKSMSNNMGMNMFRGFAVDLVAVFLLVWLLLKFTSVDLKTAVLAGLAIGGIGYLTGPYLNSIWFEGDSIGHLVDAIVQWGLVGAWLGWWLPRQQRAD